MRSIAVMNQKGGVGKTTTAVNFSAALAESGRRVCLVETHQGRTGPDQRPPTLDGRTYRLRKARCRTGRGRTDEQAGGSGTSSYGAHG